MRRFLLTGLVALVALGVMSGTGVAADEQLESTLAKAAFDEGGSSSSSVAADGTATVFGAGRQFENFFAFFARRSADGTTTGWMFFREAGGSTFFAPVECLAAAPSPGGGGIATLTGPAGPGDTLVFLVTDSNQPNGAGDELTVQNAPTFPCTPLAGVGPITSGNIVVRAN